LAKTNYTLVTGGAGYIGSHFVDEYLKRHDNIVVADSLIHGNMGAIKTIIKKHPGKLFKFHKVDLKNQNQVKKIFNQFRIDLVVHFAGLCQVGESAVNPERYFDNNLKGGINLLNAMVEAGVKKFVFSSTCATYGEAKYLPVDEKHPQEPTNPYGTSKLLFEKLLPAYETAHGIKHIILRYFNVTGAASDGSLGYAKNLKQSLLIPDAIRGALGIYPFHLTTSPVKTPDKTPIRDYVDVYDLVRGHIKAINYLKKVGTSNVFNLGSGVGYSVKQMISKVEEVTGKKIKIVKGEPRKGEYAKIYASYKKAKKILGWEPKVPLEKSIADLTTWFKLHPKGF